MNVSKRMNSQEKIFGKISFKNWLRLLLVIVVGVSVSFHISGLFRADELKRKHKFMDLQVEIQLNNLREIVTQNLDILDSTSSFFEATEVFREEFRDFSKNIMDRHKETTGIAWVPRVKEYQKTLYEQIERNAGTQDFQIHFRNEQGDKVPVVSAAEYFPLVYIEPGERNAELFGLDLVSFLPSRNAMYKAGENNEMTLAALNKNLTDADEKNLYLVFRPVYRNFNDTIIPKKDNTTLVGFVALLFLAEDLIHHALSLVDSGLDFAVYSNESGNKKLLHFHSSHSRKRASTHANFITEANKEFRRVELFEIVDTKWTIEFVPSPKFMLNLGQSHSRIVLLEGMVITGLFALFLFFSIKRLMEKESLAASLTAVNQSLLESETKFKSITSAAQDGIIVIDDEGLIMLTNPAVERMFGYAKQEMNGKSLHKMFVPQRYYADFKHGFRIFSSSGSGPLVGEIQEVYGMHKDGFEFPLEVSIASFKIDQRWHAVGVIRDITERKQVEEKLQQLTQALEIQVVDQSKDLLRSEEQLRATISSLTEGLLVEDSKGRIVLVNPEFERMFALEANFVIGKSMIDVIQPVFTDKPWLSDLEFAPFKTLIDGQVHHNEDLAFKSNGEIISVSCTSAPLRENGNVIGAVVTFDDISERKKIEKFKDEMISTVDHELRTPLTKMHGFAELLMNKDYDKRKRKQFLQVIWDETQHLNDLLNDFSDLRRIQDKNMDFHFHKERMEVLVNEIIKDWSQKWSQNGFQLIAAQNIPPIRMDKNIMGRALSALISNAVKFSPQGGGISITISKFDNSKSTIPVWVERQHDYDNAVLVSVKDQGIGIRNKEIREIFNPFFRVDSSSTATFGGTGLGLTLVKEIAELHGGIVWAESQLDVGSTFFLLLPVAHEHYILHKNVKESIDKQNLEVNV